MSCRRDWSRDKRYRLMAIRDAEEKVGRARFAPANSPPGSFARNLRNTRLRHGMSQRDLAHHAESSQHSISAYENGRVVPYPSTVWRLAHALGTSPEHLWE